MSPPIEALRQLRDHQKQIDQTGEMVGVSRQALDEVLASFDGQPIPGELPAAARQLKADLMAHLTVGLTENEAEQIVALALQRLGAPAEASPLPQVDFAELDQLVQTSDAAGRMELALRLIRQFVMGSVIHPESGGMRDWLRDWVDGNHHGPCGGPLLWPAALPTVARQMIAWGFRRSPEGFTVLALQEAPPAGEKPN